MKFRVSRVSKAVFTVALAAIVAFSLVLLPRDRAYADSSSLMAAQGLSAASETAEGEATDGSVEEQPDENTVISYAGVTVMGRGETQGRGWGDWVASGKIIGDANGEGLTAMQLQLAGVQGLAGSIRYRTYNRGSGWTSLASNGAQTASAQDVEAIRVKLTGDLALHYDVLYRAHVSGEGWRPWAKNYAGSGSIGRGVHVNAVQVKLSPKTEEAAGKSLKRVGVRYEARFKTSGWSLWKGDGKTAGKASGSKVLTGFAMQVDSGSLSGGIKYRAYNQGAKWSDWKTSGFAGKPAKRLEAMRVKLTGNLAKRYDVYYRAYCQGIGWLDWAKNGAVAGSTGFNLRLQAFEVKLVLKGADAPGEVLYPTVNLMEQSSTLNGIDIASWQAGIDIYSVSADFVIVKATEGTHYINPYFKTWAKQVLDSGKQLGIYHFATDSASARAQADFFYRTVKPYIGRAMLFLDWENTDYSDVMSKGPSFAKKWLDRVYARTGVKPLIYISQNTTWNYDWSAVAKKYKLWLAQYLYANEYSNGYLDGVTHWDIGYWKSATIYQYSSTALISGYGNRLDVSKFYGSVLSWKKLARKS